MTPAKQKAYQIIERFLPHVYCYMGSGMLSNSYDKDVAFQNAKDCAMIEVNDIIKILSVSISLTQSVGTQLHFYKDVKMALEDMDDLDERFLTKPLPR